MTRFNFDEPAPPRSGRPSERGPPLIIDQDGHLSIPPDSDGHVAKLPSQGAITRTSPSESQPHLKDRDVEGDAPRAPRASDK